jgi:adenosylhomocysteine nucleosidase
MKVFIVAMENEAEAVRRAVGDKYKIYISGIGKVNAAAATQHAIFDGATEILNCGLCGAIDQNMKIGEVYEVKSAVEYDFDLAELNGTDVGVLNERRDAYIPAMPKGIFQSKILASGDRFTNSEDDFMLLDRLNCSLRDMEGAAIAHICEKNNIQFRSLKAVSDVRGQGLMISQYKKHTTEALDALSAAIQKWA